MITKWQHEEHKEYAAQFIDDIVGKIVTDVDGVSGDGGSQQNVSILTGECVTQVENASEENVSGRDAGDVATQESVTVAEDVTQQPSLTVEEYR